MSLTPAQKQYLQIKEKYKDAILFFRMWDFYEVFYDDAKICAKVLDIALTSRDKNSSNPIPMAWIPFHAVDKYLPKLLEAGYKVAIAEQVWEVVPGKVVERKVTQVITPWTYVKEEKNENNIVAIYEENWKYYIVWWDISVWIFNVSEFSNIEDLKEQLFKIFPKEIVLVDKLSKNQDLKDYISTYLSAFVSYCSLPYLWEDKLKKYVLSFDVYGKALDNDSKRKTLALLIDYLENLSIPVNLIKIKFSQVWDYIYFDSITIRNLEILSSSYDNDKKHSLFAILDKTITNVGSRTLKNWLLHPLKNLEEINYRLEGFEYFMNFNKVLEFKKYLKQIYDIERLSYLIQYKSNNPFHWLKLKTSLNAIFELSKIDNKYLYLSEDIVELKNLLNEWLNDWDFSVEKDYIKDGFSEKVDELRKIAYHSDKLLIDYQQELVNKFWLPIKIKYINNQGYLLEVSKKDVPKFEKLMKTFDNEKYVFTRKQTLKLVERYTNDYLKSLESKILQATFELQETEKEILENWKQKLSYLTEEIENLAQQVAYIDIFINLWEFFKANNYTKPIVSDEFNEILIKKWRHPVIEQFLPKDEAFIDNDLYMKESIVHIITWPNMGWKSTYLRQNSLILLLSHCWLYVPASECKTYVLSWIFARVGSGDVLVKKQSTFMTEMIEVANILNNADEKSFIIFDELWRWTSTYDWMAISQAVIEYVVEKLKSKTLFATHYHELIKLEEKYPTRIKNFCVWVHEYDGKIIFLKKILPWGADKSYGIYVAELAWLPKEIIKKAKEIETQFDKSANKKVIVQSLFEEVETPECDKLKNKLEKIDINNITPLQALNILNDLKNF